MPIAPLNSYKTTISQDLVDKKANDTESSRVTAVFEQVINLGKKHGLSNPEMSSVRELTQALTQLATYIEHAEKATLASVQTSQHINQLELEIAQTRANNAARATEFWSALANSGSASWNNIIALMTAYQNSLPDQSKGCSNFNLNKLMSGDTSGLNDDNDPQHILRNAINKPQNITFPSSLNDDIDRMCAGLSPPPNVKHNADNTVTVTFSNADQYAAFIQSGVSYTNKTYLPNNAITTGSLDSLRTAFKEFRNTDGLATITPELIKANDTFLSAISTSQTADNQNFTNVRNANKTVTDDAEYILQLLAQWANYLN